MAWGIEAIEACKTAPAILDTEDIRAHAQAHTAPKYLALVVSPIKVVIAWLSSASEQHARAQDTGLFPVFLETRQRHCIGHRID